jgi:hypothetical protein
VTEYKPENPLIVQGDHTILVEVDNPLYVEARDALARFAELVKSPEHIHTYRVTALSIWNVCAVGDTAEAMLATLEKHASKPVPANVAEEIRAWFASCRSLSMRRSVLIEAGDRETALRVQRLLGPGCVVLKDTLLEWPGTGIDPKLRRKLTEQCLFPDAL